MKTEYLPFVIPLLIAQFALLSFTLYNILTHKTYKHGTRLMWILISLISFIGPAAYFTFGKDDD